MSTARLLRSAMLIQLALIPFVVPGSILTATRLGLVLILCAALVGWFALRDVRARGLNRLDILNWFIDLSIAAVVAGGLTLRLRAIFSSRSLWLDEVSLATGIRDFSFLTLLTESLPYNQSAPLGFLLATRLGVVTLGTGLLAIRVIPFISGMLLLVVALVLGRAAFSKRSTQLLFLLLIASSPALVYYSTEFKQYSSDAFFVLTSVLVVFVGRRSDVSWLVPILGFAGAFASLPGALAFGCLGFAILLHSYFAGELSGLVNTLRHWFGTFLVWGLGATLQVAHIMVAGTDSEIMVHWWSQRGGFPPDRIGALEQLSWYFERLIELVWMLLYPSGPIGPGTRSLPMVTLAASAVLLLLALRRGSQRVSLFATVLGLLLATAWLLAEFALYPLSSRLMIYLLPVLAFVLASGFDFGTRKQGIARLLSALAAVVLLLTTGAASVAPLLNPASDRDMHAIVRLLNSELRNGDVVVVHSSSQRILEWHDPEGTVPREAVLVANYQTPTDAGVFNTVDDRRPERVWVIATHRVGEAAEIANDIAKDYGAMATFNRGNTFVALLSRNEVALLPTGDRRLVELAGN